MIRCKTCVMPATRPDTPFIDGECAACRAYARRPTIDWDERKAQLVSLLDRHDGRCIVPSSGGKDSHYQVLTLLELGADVTIVTARTCHLTAIGRANIDNLARFARTIEVVPNMTVRAKLNRLALETVGDISWPEHCAIFTTPFNVAAELGIKLMFYGENPQDQYGGPAGSEDARVMTRRWVSEFGGFLGLRPDDFVGQEGITDRDMDDYRLTDKAKAWGTEAHFLGQYVPWDSHRNADQAKAAGMLRELPCDANVWVHENLDNAQTGVHDYFMWLKYGFGRGCQQVSVDIRTGREKRVWGEQVVKRCDGKFPREYCGVPFRDVLERIGMKREAFDACVERFKDEAIHAG